MGGRKPQSLNTNWEREGPEGQDDAPVPEHKTGAGGGRRKRKQLGLSAPRSVTTHMHLLLSAWPLENNNPAMQGSMHCHAFSL